MKIKERFARALLGSDYKAYSDYIRLLAEGYSSHADGVPAAADLTNYIRIPEYDITAYRALENKASDIAGLNVVFYKGYKEPEIIEDHPIIDIITKPNRWKTSWDLFYETVWWLEMTGECYWVLDQFSVLGGPVSDKSRIDLLNPDQMSPIPDSKNFISGFVQKLSVGRDIKYTPDEIVWFKTFHPSNPYRGLSKMVVGETVFQTDYYARRHNKYFFKNFATIGLWLLADRKIEDKIKKRIIKEIKQQYTAEKSFMTAIFDNGLKPGDREPTPKDLDFKNLLEKGTEDKSSLMGIPPARIGHLRYANFANIKEQDSMYWESSIIPILTRIKTTLNKRYFPMWAQGEEIWMDFDLTKVKALQEDSKLKADEAVALHNSGIFTANEIRQDYYGKEEIEGGEVLKAQRIPYEIPPEKRLHGKGFDPDTEKWWQKDLARRKHEGKMLDATKKYLNDARERLIKNISAYADDYIFTVIDVSNIYYSLKEQQELEDKTVSYILNAFAEAGQFALDEVAPQKRFKQGEEEIIGQFDMDDPLVQQYIEGNTARYVVGVTDVTKQQVRDYISRGIDEGWSLQQYVEGLTSKFPAFSKARALRIAQTEIGASMNSASMYGYRQSGMVKKKRWLTARDGRVRPSHEEAENEGAIQFEELFHNGLEYPLDMKGDSEEVVNCRCALEPVVEE